MSAHCAKKKQSVQPVCRNLHPASGSREGEHGGGHLSARGIARRSDTVALTGSGSEHRRSACCLRGFFLNELEHELRRVAAIQCLLLSFFSKLEHELRRVADIEGRRFIFFQRARA